MWVMDFAVCIVDLSCVGETSGTSALKAETAGFSRMLVTINMTIQHCSFCKLIVYIKFIVCLTVL